MIRTHTLPCTLARAEADALNRESGRVYTETLIWQYRIYRRKGIWLSPGASERLGDFLSSTSLHAHSRDGAQQAFHKACKTAKANRSSGAKYPHQQKVSGWSHGRQIALLTYKLANEGIAVERQNEAYSSKTCCGCGAQNKPRGRTYRCAVCGLVCHRDANGAVNQESKALYGSYSRIQPGSITYRRAFRRSSGRSPARSWWRLPPEAAGL